MLSNVKYQPSFNTAQDSITDAENQEEDTNLTCTNAEKGTTCKRVIRNFNTKQNNYFNERKITT